MPKMIGFALVGAALFGIAGVRLCQWMTSTPKFCGLMMLYMAPLGLVVGALVGGVWSKLDK